MDEPTEAEGNDKHYTAIKRREHERDTRGRRHVPVCVERQPDGDMEVDESCCNKPKGGNVLAAKVEGLEAREGDQGEGRKQEEGH